ncbi:MAG TPA: NUDIX domain-containing protein [Anaerolineae bacterium]|nr:NUDIX domain-containing protein [Anaerolineae bacterium]HQH38930.1 NUDIX domain-containing protein [Anaerolineae bacterium]
MGKQAIRITYTAGGGVLTNAAGTDVLLLIRPARDEVRLPKGHIEPEESAADAALREVVEETGYDDIEIVADLGEQWIAFPLGDKIVRRTEHYFLMRARSLHQTERPRLDEQQFFTIWVPWNEAITHLTFEVEQEWIRRARQRLERPA